MQPDKNQFLNKLEHTDQGSRVWIYQAAQPFWPAEKELVTGKLTQFLTAWNTHGTPMNADAGLLFGHFIVFVADESKFAASGCSIDQSVQLIREIQQGTGKDLFDRRTVAYADQGQVKTLPLDGLSAALSQGIINSNTLVFDNLITQLAQLFDGWIKPLGESWHAQFLEQRV